MSGLFDFLLHADQHHHDSIHVDHAHIRQHSDAVDSDNDGFSDAFEIRYGTDPLDANSHPVVDSSWVDGHHTPISDLRDSDHDGFSDSVEKLMGTDPYDAHSHPDVVLPYHMPEGSGHNLPYTLDVTPHSDNNYFADPMDISVDAILLTSILGIGVMTSQAYSQEQSLNVHEVLDEEINSNIHLGLLSTFAHETTVTEDRTTFSFDWRMP